MAVEVPHYSGWRPRSMRVGRSTSDSNRGSKRSRLSKAKADRVLYCHPKAHKLNPERYAKLCEIADGLNGRRV